jgi:hypothetical protein
MTLPRINATDRDAPNLWGGLRYQKLVTLCAWLDLHEGELLHVEKEEDLTVARPGGAEAIQVRRTRATISLGREDARKMIEIAWSRDPAMVTVYWTTSPVGQESWLRRNHDAKGIDLWTRAAEGDDGALEAVRTYLNRRNGWSPRLSEALETESADGLRASLFRRLRWEAQRPPTAVLQARAKAQLLKRLEGRAAAPANAAKLILSHCLERIDAVAERGAEDRQLDFVDLEEAFETVLVMAQNISALDAGVNIGGHSTSPSWAIQAIDTLRRRLERAGLEDLEVARSALVEGRVHAAIRVIDTWVGDADAESGLRGAALRLRAEASLALANINDAESFATQATASDGVADPRLRLLILAARDPSAALSELDDAQGDLAWLKAECLIRTGDGAAARAVADAIPGEHDDAYAGRVRAMAYAITGDVKGALRLIDPLRSRFPDVELTVAAGVFHYVAAQAKGLTVALTNWPAPTNAGLVRQSDSAQEHLRLAASLFGQAARLMDDPRQKADKAIWHIACLAGLVTPDPELESLVREFANGARPHPGAVHWALSRSLAFDATDSETKLSALVLAGEADGEDLVACAALLAFRAAEKQALQLLEDQKSRLGSSDQDLVQSWIDRLRDTGSDTDRVSRALRNAQETGDWSVVAAMAVEVDRPPPERFTLLRILAGNDQWTTIASQSDFLLSLETAEALRLAALAAHNCGDMPCALKLLEEKLDLFPGGVRPDDLTGIYIEALAASDRLPEAFAQLETWALGRSSRGARMMEIRLRLNLGDLEGVASRAAELRFEELPLAFRLQVANQIASAAPEQARALLRTIDIRETPIALLPVAFETAEFTRLDSDLRRQITHRLFSGEAQEAGIVTPVSVEEILELAQSQTNNGEVDAYERGDAPLHRLAHARIGRAFLALLSNSDGTSDLYTRDASAIDAERITAHTLRLDVTAMMTAHALGLIDKLYGCFDRVEVAPHLQVALQNIERDLHVGPPEKLEALQAIVSRIGDGRVTVSLAPGHARRLGFVADGPESSCGDVVETLVGEGVLTVAAATRAREILGMESKLLSRSLGDKEMVATNAAVAALLHEAGILDPLLASRHVILDTASARAIRAECDHLVRLQAAAASVTALRQRVWRDLRGGRLHHAPLGRDFEDTGSEPRSPILETIRELRAPGASAAIWVEDRAIHLRRPLEGLPVVQAYDVVQHLRARRALSHDESTEALRRLRAGGFRFLPVSDDEVLALLRSAAVEKGDLIETPELRTCRRAFARDLMCERSLRLHPDEHALTAETRFALNAVRRFEHLLKAVWEQRASVAKRRAWSDWLWWAFRCDRLERTPLAGADEPGRRAIYEIYLAGRLSLSLMAGRTRKDKAAAYEWVWARLIAPELHADPSLATSLSARFAELWTTPFIDERGRRARDTVAGRGARAQLCLALLMDMPEPMRDLLMEDSRLRRFLAKLMQRQLSFGGFTFQASPVLSAMEHVFSTGRSRRVTSNEEVLTISREDSKIVIQRSAQPHRLIVEDDLLTIVLGVEIDRRGAVSRALEAADIDPLVVEPIASAISAIEDPYERLVRLNEEREATVEGTIDLLRTHAQANRLSITLLKSPPPAAVRRWLRCGKSRMPTVAMLYPELGGETLERLASAPLRAWADVPLAVPPEEIAAYVDKPQWSRSPIGELARLRLLAPQATPANLRGLIVELLERFRNEGEALVELVRQIGRQMDRDALWRAEDEVFRSLAGWVWADILWRTLASVQRDPVALAHFWKRAISMCPRDLVFDARTGAAMASPSISAARLLAGGLEFALGDRREESWTEKDTRELAKSALDAARQGNPLGPLAQAPDRDVTWLADASPFIWRDEGGGLDTPAKEAVERFPSDESALALVTIGGPDTVDEGTADALLEKLEADPSRSTRGEHWIANLRFAALAVRALNRRGALTDARAERAFALFSQIVAELRNRDDWKNVRDPVYHHVATLMAALPAERIAKVLSELFDAAPAGDRKFVHDVAGIFLAALPFEERAPIWREHLRMRSVV